MQKDACCTGTGLCKWFCPSIVGMVAGLIMVCAGVTKFLGGKAALTFVGGMSLSIVGIGGHSKVALILGAIAATIEVLGGLSFAFGCRMTSRYAALGLTVVMAVAVLFKLTHLQHVAGGLGHKVLGLVEQTRLDVLLFAVFFAKSLKFVKKMCGMDCGSCCSMDPKKK